MCSNIGENSWCMFCNDLYLTISVLRLIELRYLTPGFAFLFTLIKHNIQRIWCFDSSRLVSSADIKCTNDSVRLRGCVN